MKKYNVLFCCFFLAIVCNVFAKEKPGANEITAIEKNNLIPVLKGLAVNPVMKIMVVVPAGNTAQPYSKLQGTITHYNEVEKIDVYLTGAEPFSAIHLIGSYRPTSAAFAIPITVTVQPGMQFIWISVVLKND